MQISYFSIILLFIGPIVYRLGHILLKDGSGVRLPVGLLVFMEKFVYKLKYFIELIDSKDEKKAEKYFTKEIQPFLSELEINDERFDIVTDISDYLRFGIKHGFDLENVKLYLFQNNDHDSLDK